VLDLIHADGQVLMPRYRIEGDKPVLELAKIGRNLASTFTGLCSKHDNEIFKIIDAQPLDVDSEEHLRLLAYRSVMRELHTTIEQANRFMSLDEELTRAAGTDPQAAVTLAFLYALEFYKKAHNVFRYRGKHFDTPIQQGKPPDLKHSVLELPNQTPILAVSALFSTSHTVSGDIVGPRPAKRNA
jgi:hypothetical protein